MPIEIRELVVRARIEPGPEPAPGGAAPAGGQDEEERRALVSEALRALADRHER